MIWNKPPPVLEHTIVRYKEPIRLTRRQKAALRRVKKYDRTLHN